MVMIFFFPARFKSDQGLDLSNICGKNIKVKNSSLFSSEQTFVKVMHHFFIFYFFFMRAQMVQQIDLRCLQRREGNLLESLYNESLVVMCWLKQCCIIDKRVVFACLHLFCRSDSMFSF